MVGTNIYTPKHRSSLQHEYRRSNINVPIHMVEIHVKPAHDVDGGLEFFNKWSTVCPGMSEQIR